MAINKNQLLLSVLKILQGKPEPKKEPVVTVDVEEEEDEDEKADRPAMTVGDY